MSKYVRKYQQGEQITSLHEAIEHILSGGHVYYGHKFMHCGFAGGLSLWSTIYAIERGILYRADRLES